MSGLVIVVNLILAKQYINIDETRIETSNKKIPFRAYFPLLVLAILGMIVMGNEGAIEHWSSIYLKDIVKVTSENLVGLGFSIFSISMTIGRFFGDGISEKIGSGKVIVLGCFLAVVGYILVLLQTLSTSIIGFGIIGLGLSVIVPELLRLAGKSATSQL